MASSLSRTSFACLRWTSNQSVLRMRATPSTLVPSFRSYSADATPKTAPALTMIKSDLKTAMRAKDAPRLAVLRAILAANLNASKTTKPIETDIQFVALLQKLRKNSYDTIAEAEAAGREDLAEKEKLQAEILEEYIKDCGVETVAAEELLPIVQKAVETVKEAGAEGKGLVGKSMAAVLKELAGKDVDKKTISEMIADVVAGKK